MKFYLRKDKGYLVRENLNETGGGQYILYVFNGNFFERHKAWNTMGGMLFAGDMVLNKKCIKEITSNLKKELRKFIKIRRMMEGLTK